jgi:hypothetical protein
MLNEKLNIEIKSNLLNSKHWPKQLLKDKQMQKTMFN